MCGWQDDGHAVAASTSNGFGPFPLPGRPREEGYDQGRALAELLAESWR